MANPRIDPETARRIMEEGMRRAADKSTIDMRIAEQREAYKAAGFDVLTHGELKKQPHINVVVTEAKVDDDFYDHS